MPSNDHDAILEGLEDRSTGRFSRDGKYDATSFDLLLERLWERAGEIRDEPAVPRQLLRCARDVAKAIRESAVRATDPEKRIARAREFDVLMDRLIG